ncbi:MAG: hypothetical protein KC731_15270, partial [Myxococcales bacterium]|nr:hypothetical protein [Myxococcales bacterium]
MAFRSEREADRHRIDALEDELEEKEAEIARLRNKMAARKEPRPPEAKGRVPEVQDLPEGPLLAIPTHDPSAWKIGAIWLLTLAGVMGY